MNATRLPGPAVVGLALCLGGVAPAANAAPTAADLMKGGEFCFDMSESGTDAFEHLMLAVEPAASAMAEVHAIQRGNVGGAGYANQLAGTAAIAPSNDAGSDAPTLYISLMGNGMGIGADGSAGLYTFSFSLVLDPATLAGKVYGSEHQSGALAEGKALAAEAAVGRLTDAKPIPCADY
jgi:hypothetical protein